MNYSEILAGQWTTLKHDFQINLAKRKDAALSAEKLDQWYELGISRWESSIEAEGAILQQQNKKLASDILHEMKAFRFKNVDIVFHKQAVIKGVVLFIAGVALGIVEYMVLPIPKLVRFLLAIVVAALMALEALKGVQKSRDADYETVRKEYLLQLQAEGEKLVSICKEYEC